MTEGERKKLKSYYGSLREQQRQLDVAAEQLKHMSVGEPQFMLIVAELANVRRDFPGLLPPLDPSSLAQGTSRNRYYNLPGLRSYLAAALARIGVQIESTDSAPVTEQRVFRFISDSDVRAIVERDFEEAQRAWVARCWKSVIILCGGLIEAILLDLVQRDEVGARSAAKAPPGNLDLLRWDIGHLIAVAVELKLVSAGVEKLSQSVREFRNLVHPGREVRSRMKFDSEEARIALEVVNILHRELT